MVTEVPHDDFSVPQKAPCVTTWKHHQDAVYWKRLQRAQDQGIEFWQTKSFATMAYTTIQGECIDRVVSRNDSGRTSTFRKARNTKTSTQGD